MRRESTTIGHHHVGRAGGPRRGRAPAGPATVFARAGLVLLAATLTAAFAQPQAVTVMKGLNEPQDVLVGPDGTIYVADSGTGSGHINPVLYPGGAPIKADTIGDTGRVIALAPDGSQTVLAKVLSTPDGAFFDGANGLALLGDKLYAAVAGWDKVPTPRPPLGGAIAAISGGNAVKVADTWEFEVAHKPDGFAPETHPYRLAAGPDGDLWVTDASANDLLKVDPATGKITLAAVFPELPSTVPNAQRNNAKLQDPVPTGLVVRSDGSALVAFLPGSPIDVGASKIVEVAPDGTISDYATGFTTITDLKVGPDGKLYAVEFGAIVDHQPRPGTGSLVRVTANGPQTVLSGLRFPTAVAFTARGDALITVGGLGDAGTGELLRFAGVAAP